MLYEVITLLVSGVSGLIASNAGDLEAVVRFLNGLFASPTIVTVVIIVLSVCEIIAGFFLLMESYNFV